jgi:energy-coupling factor transporter transmembrane protein EcfT
LFIARSLAFLFSLFALSHSHTVAAAAALTHATTATTIVLGIRKWEAPFKQITILIAADFSFLLAIFSHTLERQETFSEWSWN